MIDDGWTNTDFLGGSLILSIVHFAPNPFSQDGYERRLFGLCQGAIFWIAVPFIEAATTASGAGVLRDKNWMTAPWRLLAVAWWIVWCETGGDKIRRVRTNCIDSLLLDIRTFFFAQMKLGSKTRFFELSKNFIIRFRCSHISSIKPKNLPC